MKTSNLHPYHGITQRNDCLGWVIQIRLMGKYRVLRSYAANAEEAARRHDMALSKLDSFTDYNARPNFPLDYDKIVLSRDASPEPSHRAFYDELQKLFSSMCEEAKFAGRDIADMQSERNQLAKACEESRKMRATMEYGKFLERLTKLRLAVSSLSLPAAKREQLSDLLAKVQQVLDNV